MLWVKLKKHITENVDTIIVSMPSAAGHKVLYTPPHHSDLQPIELIWAIVKGEVGRQYSTSTSFKDVYNRLVTAFNSVTPNIISGCIEKSEEHLLKFYSYIYSIDNEDNESDGEDSASDQEDDIASSSSDEE